MVLVFVRLMDGKSVPFDVSVSANVWAFKEQISAQLGSLPHSQRLIFAGQIMKDSSQLSDYNVSKECTIQLYTSNAPFQNRQNMRKNSSMSFPPEEHEAEGGQLTISSALSHGDIVIVKLVEARNLERADFWSGSSDPYVIFALGNYSAKSKVIKRNINPLWNETFGFRINEGDQSAILSILVFDFDNFTPDDFIGSAEINLSEIPCGDLYDKWLKLDNVQTGEIHLQFQRNLITSPTLNRVINRLTSLERSWEQEDLSRQGVTIEQITGQDAWLSKNMTNPALEYLMQSIQEKKIEWISSSLKRVEMILESQKVLPTPGIPTRHLWISGISVDIQPKDLFEKLRPSSKLKHINLQSSKGFLILDFSSLEGALITFLELQNSQLGKMKMIIGFGKYEPYNSDWIENKCVRAGFLNVSIPGSSKVLTENWQLCWVVLSNENLSFFRDIQSTNPIKKMPTKDVFVCSQGLHSVEIFDSNLDESVFLRSECESEMELWKLDIKKTKKSKVERPPKLIDSWNQECTRCGKSTALNSLFSRDKCSTFECISCLRDLLLLAITEQKCRKLSKSFTINDIRELLNHDEFEKFLEVSLAELLDQDKNFVKCPNCDLAAEFINGEFADAPEFSRIQGLDKKPLNDHAQHHYLQNRLRCRNSQCSTSFCRSCGETPYHTGFDCSEYKLYKNADHCRFCDCALLPKLKALNSPSPALDLVCNSEECLRKRDHCCDRTLECGCPCGGIRGEEECLPCLLDDHRPADINQSSCDFCNICFTESLSSSPSICLDCGHIFHYECIKKRLEEGWSSTNISFSFASCPLCNVRISHELLEETLAPIQSLFKDIEQRAYARSEYEGLLNDPSISSECGEFYRNPAGFSMDYFAYYMCFKCKNPYFGGQQRCNDGLDRFDPSDLICGSCSGVGIEECSKHGKEFIIYKCRFCCNVSSWNCWGTTHFCNECHSRQEAHDYMTIKSADQLPQCPGPDKCPLKVEHLPNGTEFSLGCALCKGI